MKDNLVGERVTIREYDTRIRLRYELTDRTYVEMNERYVNFEYEDQIFQGYQEFRNDDWLNRNFGDKLSAGLGAAIGSVIPDATANQTYEQALGRAAYRISGKVNLSAEGGVDVREYDQANQQTIHPTFNMSGLYQPWATTTFSLNAYGREEPSPSAEQNYTVYGLSAGGRQLIFSRFHTDVNAGYNSVNFAASSSGGGDTRTDGFYFARVRLDYDLNPHWTASVFYTRNQNDSTASEFS